MAIYLVTNRQLTAIANTIREKNKSDQQYSIDQLPDAIIHLGETQGSGALELIGTDTVYAMSGSKLTAIANAIRHRNGSDAQYSIDDMPNAITNISTSVNINYYNGQTLLRTDTILQGDDAIYLGTTPTKDATSQYAYTFSGWSKDIDDGIVDADALSSVNSDRNVYACFVATTRKYTITWKNSNGTVLETDTNVPYGTVPTYNGAIPTQDGEPFVTWIPTISTVMEDAIYTASYDIIMTEPNLKYLVYTTDDTNMTMRITGLKVSQIVADQLNVLTIPDTIQGYRVILA